MEGRSPAGAAARDAGSVALRDLAGEAREAAGKVKPALRGVSHQYAFLISLLAGGALIGTAPPGTASIAALIYALSLTLLLGTSALYHRIDWSERTRPWMRRLDHSMIFVLIAGTYTPFAMLALPGALGTAVLIVLWGAAAAGIVMKLGWIHAPYWVTAIVYLAVGWVGVGVMPKLVGTVGALAVGLLCLGGALYTAGAVIYALRRPNPAPQVFGFHEIFHALVIAAAGIHFAVIAAFVLPLG